MLLVACLGLLQINEVNILLFGVTYLWPIVLSSKKLRAKAGHPRQRYSFLRTIFFLYDLPLEHPLLAQKINSHPIYPQLLLFLGPGLFALILWMITGAGNFFFVMLAMGYYLSVQWALKRYFPQALPADF